MAEAEKKVAKRTGRPPKNPELGKRINVMFRLNEARRDQLMRDAERNGRSMSEEIEYRLERSYTDVDAISRYFGRPETVELALTISSLSDRIEKETGKKWSEDSYTMKMFYSAITRIMHLYFEEHKGELLSKPEIGKNQKLPADHPGYFLGMTCADALSLAMGLDTSVKKNWDEFMKTRQDQTQANN
ncbi:hypothetical protein FF100_03950 [Methylobacterium terricola]|uniref:Arc-like DNA binding domain-containing protein n=1 Tax=Methylobacterium terricola TaxID=2583531 RepID=A0A5C4LPP6_9HYPH|nr:hypothetical protein [Methylobacterium terricola]TNC16408.1 hypothetical protein FF100_03950 [Methylobacterium terricola]